MHSDKEVSTALRFVADGLNDCEISRLTAIPRTTIRDWRHGRTPGRQPRRARGADGRASTCLICEGREAGFPEQSYAYLLGMYLGDGCISKAGRTYRMRITLDARYPKIVAQCAGALEKVRHSGTAWCGKRKESRCVEVGMYWNHWPCLFPQHGPGRKHDRRIELEPWQGRIVERNPRDLVKALIESDGCRVVANDRGAVSVRYHFSNRSEDIKRIFCDALANLGIPWTRPCDQQIAIYRQRAVSTLDEFIGPKR